MPTGSIQTLLASIVDYAGLFPPAKLSMNDMATRFARHASGRCRWMLNRVIVPVDRLGEFGAATSTATAAFRKSAGDRSTSDAPMVDEEHAPDATLASATISALITTTTFDDLCEEFERLHQFNETHAGHANLVVDAVELKARDSGAIETALAVIERLGEDILTAVEIPIDADPRGLIAAIAAADGPVIAKVRTGGVTPGAIPSPLALAQFICACAASGCPFKATAGLHHPMRTEHALTYQPGAPRAMMHGFLNVLFASATAMRDRAKQPEIASILEETNPKSFQLSESGASWAGRQFSDEELALARERVFLSFGSCSFSEPVRDLRDMGLL